MGKSKQEILKKILKEKKLVVPVPVTIKFGKKEIKATRGTEVIRWIDFLKALREACK
jgi:hypothetical protein